MLHIVIGIAVAILVWKLIKITFKSLFWFILAGIIAFIIFPKALVFVGGIGFLVIGFLITLIVLAVGGLFLYENE
jgi:hypothetical protein